MLFAKVMKLGKKGILAICVTSKDSQLVHVVETGSHRFCKSNNNIVL